MSSRIKLLFDLADKFAVKLVAQGGPVTCHRGCSACCSEAVYTSLKEARYVVSAIPPAELAETKRRAAAWLEKFKGAAVFNEAEPKVDRYLEAGLVCPLLRDKQCLVYARRPVACRLHLAIGPCELCQPKTRLTQTFISSPEALAVVGQASMSACNVQQDGFEADHLGVWLAELLLDCKLPAHASRLAIPPTGTA